MTFYNPLFIDVEFAQFLLELVLPSEDCMSSSLQGIPVLSVRLEVVLSRTFRPKSGSSQEDTSLLIHVTCGMAKISLFLLIILGCFLTHCWGFDPRILRAPEGISQAPQLATWECLR